MIGGFHNTERAGLSDEADIVARLSRDANLTLAARRHIADESAALVRLVRQSSSPNIMESLLAEYKLTGKEGVALMCLAEALLRVPDTATIDALISDKITSSDWRAHLGRSDSTFVNASTWALMLTGRMVSHRDLGSTLRAAVCRLGEPVVRAVISQAMREIGGRFILGRNIAEGVKRAEKNPGYYYSYDMLGEVARTEVDAERYYCAYADAINHIARGCAAEARTNPGISIKLSALHPRYEHSQRARIIKELTPRLQALARQAAAANMGCCVDAEESARLDLSLEIISATLADSALRGWDGFGLAVQAYDKRAAGVLDWTHNLARHHNCRLMVRLVKGAYWDTEIKRAQTLGIADYPVFTRKAHTDIAYLSCARRLLDMTDRIYPQFATHNAHTMAAVLHMAVDKTRFEFQRLHGMGESLHHAVVTRYRTRCRIYAPVGAYQDLLAYLMRRLLENSAGNSFVHRLVDKNLSAEAIARDPSIAAETVGARLPLPATIFGDRKNSRGWDLDKAEETTAIKKARGAFAHYHWEAAPMLAVAGVEESATTVICNPANSADIVGSVREATPDQVRAAWSAAHGGVDNWGAIAVARRAACLEKTADLYESAAMEFFALCAREAGKTLADGVAEVREAVDFLRYYAQQARLLPPQATGRGVVVCISPWNFPLAIFTGQIAAALVAGNAVIAKPAEQTPLIAAKAVALMRQAGILPTAIQLLPGGAATGAALTAQADVASVCFTGSTAVARQINQNMAANASPKTPFIAETGGLNAMIADSSTLPEQLVRDVIASAFQSAGQRCSALRLLYVQKDIEERLLNMLIGAMDVLIIGDPWDIATDIGPVIDKRAHVGIERYCEKMEAAGRLIHKLTTPAHLSVGHFIAPSLFRVGGIDELAHEVFGPVLHVASYEAGDLERVVDDINAKGYGLTFGVHSRIDARVRAITAKMRVGNAYINRNQIGAAVGSQPFGGEGLSGTGPKAGGPNYVPSFCRLTQNNGAVFCPSKKIVPLSVLHQAIKDEHSQIKKGRKNCLDTLCAFLNALPPAVSALAGRAAAAVEAVLKNYPMTLPGPTGESNRLFLRPRGVFLCLGDGNIEMALAQAVQSVTWGGGAVLVAEGAPSAGLPFAALDGAVTAATIEKLTNIAGVAMLGGDDQLCPYRAALAVHDGPILPFITEVISPLRYAHERVICEDTTAAGGNAALLAASD